jgi:hypothetical protein
MTRDDTPQDEEVLAMATTRRLMLLAAVLLPACSSSPGASPTADAGTDAVAVIDSGTVDTGVVDSGAADTGAQDTGLSQEAEAGCAYPAGPYGTAVGNVLDPSSTWQGYLPNATDASTLKMSDLYDCDGSKGINAIVFDNAAQWCVACQYVAAYIPGWMSASGGNWSGLGVAFVTLVIQTNEYEPATVTTAEQWRNMFNLASGTYVAADPQITFATDSLPHTLLVNPRTMTITANLDDDPNYGETAADPAVTQLATMNKQ